MFSIGFVELLVVLLLALVVVGPERLPATIRVTTTHLKALRHFGRNTLRALERETGLAELVTQTRQTAIIDEAENLSASFDRHDQQLEASNTEFLDAIGLGRK